MGGGKWRRQQNKYIAFPLYTVFVYSFNQLMHSRNKTKKNNCREWFLAPIFLFENEKIMAVWTPAFFLQEQREGSWSLR